MKHFLKIILITFSLIGLLTACHRSEVPHVKIGIIIPLEHAAMNAIVAGFSEELPRLYSKPIIIKAMNAQNDPNLERAIIQQMRDEKYNLIVPIGMDASQMTMAMVKKQPILSLASEISDQDRKKRKPCNIAVVQDEISPARSIEFIHAVYPKLKQLTLIHSTSNKVFPDVNTAIAAGKQYGITINHVMISALPDLYSVAKTLPKNTEGIFILKDHLIVSGISTLRKIADQRHIPLITSDQGSVEDGATFALGVHEKEIGIEGAKLAANILEGKPICELPIVTMQKLTVFINKNIPKNDTIPIVSQDSQFDYNFEFVG